MGDIGLLVIGVAILISGASYGIGRLAAAGLEATGRQPEAADDIMQQIAVASGFIDGLGFGALVIVAIAIFVL